MEKLACSNCGMRSVCRSSRISWIFFLVGIIATVGMRAIEPLRIFNQTYATLAWYIGVAGFFLFFIYKYWVVSKRSKIIRESKLKEKIASKESLSEVDYALLNEILCSQDNWKERTNFLIIFTLSALALAFAVYKDFLA